MSAREGKECSMRTNGLLSKVVGLAVLAAALVVSLPMGGCDVSKEFSKAATPLAEQINNDAMVYLDRLPDTDISKAMGKAQASRFLSAAQAGDAMGTGNAWFGPDRFRATYVALIEKDPRAGASGWSDLKRIKLTNVETMDFVINKGTNNAFK